METEIILLFIWDLDMDIGYDTDTDARYIINSYEVQTCMDT